MAKQTKNIYIVGRTGEKVKREEGREKRKEKREERREAVGERLALPEMSVTTARYY